MGVIFSTSDTLLVVNNIITCSALKGRSVRLSSNAHSLARNVRTRCSPHPVVLMPTVKPPFFSTRRRCAQQPQPKHDACPTRPGCLRAIPPLLTVLATFPDLKKKFLQFSGLPYLTVICSLRPKFCLWGLSLQVYKLLAKF